MSDQIESPFCIIMSDRHKTLLRNQGRLEEDPILGLQRQCSMCEEWWPMDTAFFIYAASKARHRMEAWCRDCSNTYKSGYKVRSVETKKVNPPPDQ